MKRLQVDGNRTVRVVEVPDPEPGPGEVVVKTAVSALCGSELGGYRRDRGMNGNGGHEAAGTIVRLGPDVRGLEIGQRVGLSAVVGCGECAACSEGKYTWCRKHRTYANMHAELIVIAARGCHVLPDDVPWEAGVLLSGDGLGVPFHTASKIHRADVRTVAVFGVGPVGLGNTLVQSNLGREVIAVDVSLPRLELARKLGAVDVIDAAAADPVARILDLTQGNGADICIECAGRPETLKQCFAAVRTGGQVLINGEQPSVELSPSRDFIRRDITATGSWFYHFSEFEAMLRLYRQGLDIAKLITHRFPLSEADAAFKAYDAGTTGKVLLTMAP